VELTLAVPITVEMLLKELDLVVAGPEAPDIYVAPPGSLSAMEGRLTVTLEPPVASVDGSPQRLRMTWEPYDELRVPPPSSALVATPWYALVRELERRLLAGDGADAVEAWLRSGAGERPWLAASSVRRQNDRPDVIDKVDLTLTSPLPVTDVIAAFGHYVEWIPIHFRDDPLDLAFDPVVGAWG
jgi:hypothetical protein